MLWEGEKTERENAADEDEEPSPYGDMLSTEEFERLFGESDEQYFEGF